MDKSIPSRRRRKKIWWDYSDDGLCRDRIKGWIKRYWARWRRRRENAGEK